MVNNPLPRLLRLATLRAITALSTSTQRFRPPLPPDTPMLIIAFKGFGNRHGTGWHGHLQGRILVDKLPGKPGRWVIWNNLRENLARFNTREQQGIRISAQIGTLITEVVSDRNGYFIATFQSTAMASADLIDVTLRLPEYNTARMTGEPCIQLVPIDARFAVISDIDDTILLTNTKSLASMLRRTLLESSASRLACAGISDFYQGLHQNQNPFFYVSSSPWNLYEFLVDFMRHQNIVPGPLLLRDFGLDEEKFITGSHYDHKLKNIRRILNTYPELPFILAGDSAQDDPEIYARIAQEYAPQIKAIYLRDVSHQQRRRSIQALIGLCKARTIPMLLVQDWLTAATHAMTQGWLDEKALANISASTHEYLNATQKLSRKKKHQYTEHQ